MAGALAAALEFGRLEEVHSTGLAALLPQVLEQFDQITNMVAQAFFRTEGYSKISVSSEAVPKSQVSQLQEN